MTLPLVTIAVVPRERFSYSIPSLESLLEKTPLPYDLIYVDGGSPPPVRQALEEKARAHSFRLIRTENFLGPNEARNLALPHVRTKYFVSADNDVVFEPDWLEALVECAEESGAWVVGPLTAIATDPAHPVVHMTGGEARIEERDGKRYFNERHLIKWKPLPEVRGTLQRGPTGLVEFHCLLLNMDAIRKLGPLDPKFMSMHEHVDLCMQVLEAGESVYIAPDSIVTQIITPPFEWTDLEFFQARWSPEWCDASLTHFKEKWNLADDDASDLGYRKWIHRRRRTMMEGALDEMLWQ